MGWLRIPGTAIDYPIAKGDDNSYYLSHTFSRQANSAGAIFLDEINARDFSDRNAILYGHNMKNGSMFHDLIQYEQQAYYDAHPTIYLYLSGHTYKLEIFSVYVAIADTSMRRIDFADDAAFTDYLKTLQAKSMVDTPALTGTEEKILTLITCTYEYDNARLLVHARVVEESSAAAEK